LGLGLLIFDGIVTVGDAAGEFRSNVGFGEPVVIDDLGITVVFSLKDDDGDDSGFMDGVGCD
jgi:hypothetical protein